MIDNSSPPIVKSVATRIDYLRELNDLSIRALAKKSGVSTSTMFDIINGNKIPNIYTLHSICNALDISLSDFFNFDDNIIALRGKEAILIKIFREISPMSQDTLIKVSKCMK
ncbi:MAG: helix-turn-helix transcriptional regulator [Clostridia bacterium]|nr:helix-turn-helix transcriptional regulator [Clostridia bacterium]